MTRVSFPYFMNQEVVDYIIRAVIMVAKDGWKLLSQVRIFKKCFGSLIYTVYKYI